MQENNQILKSQPSTSKIPARGLYFRKSEILQYLDLLTSDVTISKFLDYDKCCRLADNYLLASVFVYFKRSGLTIRDYSFTNFFAALLLAHSMVEENDYFIEEITHWALPNCWEDRSLVRQLESVKFLMFQAMGFRALVSRTCCDNVMSVVSHPFWSRKRDHVHAGVYKRASKCLLRGNEPMFNKQTASCKICRTARCALLSIHYDE